MGCAAVHNKLQLNTSIARDSSSPQPHLLPLLQLLIRLYRLSFHYRLSFPL